MPFAESCPLCTQASALRSALPRLLCTKQSVMVLALPPAVARAGHEPLRVLPRPRALAAWPARGQPLCAGLPAVRDIRSARRMWTDWWRPEPTQRDYLEVTLADGAVGWVFVEPHTGRAFRSLIKVFQSPFKSSGSTTPLYLS